MKEPEVVASLEALGERERRSVWLAVGMFDGVHPGHASVVNLAVKGAEETKGTPAVLTFPEHPAAHLRPGREPALLMSPEAKAAALLASGAEKVVMLPFDEAFASITAETFVPALKKAVPSLRAVCVGENFRFGRDRAGDVEALRRFAEPHDLLVKVAPSALHEGEPVSSSRLRAALAAGEIEQVNAMLGAPYEMAGTVEPGRAAGRELGFPTLNLRRAPQARPAYGVYCVEATVEGAEASPFPGVANYGLRPTMQDADESPLLETHLLGEGEFSSFGPGDRLTVRFLRFLRPERKFASVEELCGQIAKDKAAAESEFAGT